MPAIKAATKINYRAIFKYSLFFVSRGIFMGFIFFSGDNFICVHAFTRNRYAI
ncbi:hypothetical protein EBL_c23660 [Shimwellia blattae DSM 4481 = NBRC 105725]|uniref:Uncharacterized protein n=1 Tax=Shimwellia blattae (strain ATCC 29907 / DSM 4481 / JCM 1650 / NBRC 105725 / CDC 9005-74) TaxID=630626 RepID=I2BAA1_SHIBC|nr:hypothetical protein EBL_c23660 [Shimwellia blattae DSM 4481 = NBRC 105725]